MAQINWKNLATWRFFGSSEQLFDVVSNVGDVIDERDAPISNDDRLGADDAAERPDAGGQRLDARDHESLKGMKIYKINGRVQKCRIPTVSNLGGGANLTNFNPTAHFDYI